MEILTQLQNLLTTCPEIERPTYLPAEKLSSQEKEFLCEHFLGGPGWHNANKGQGFIVDKSAHFLTTLNIQDHLILQWVDCKGNWKEAWQTLDRVETSIGKHVEYAFSSRFGYLTSHPSLCGTGLKVVCYLHLPALISSQKLSKVIREQVTEEVETIGLLGSKEDLIGDFLLVQNKYTLGVSEESILRTLHSVATHLVIEEQDARLTLQKTKNIQSKDAISRAYGLLLHSYLLDTGEALNALSKLKLGIALGWIEGITDQEINELLFRCRRAHLLQSHEKISLDKKELAQARAQYLHDKLQQMVSKF